MSQKITKKRRSKFGHCRVPMPLLNWIRKAVFKKSEFFELWPNYDYNKEGLPQVLIKKVQDEKEAKKNRPTVKELEREVDRGIERRKSKLECGCKAHTKDKKSCKRLSKVKSQPPVVRRSKKVPRVSQPPVKKVVGVVKPTMSTISNDQRREVNLYLPFSSNQSSSYAVIASPAPSLLYGGRPCS